jgi:hypothetical protein
MANLDGLGPYSVRALREMAQRWPPTAKFGTDVMAAQLGAENLLPTAFHELEQGRPVVLLWRESPTFGHFILLHWRKGGVEVFDPLGVDGAGPTADVWEGYMDDPRGLNGGGLRPHLQRLEQRGVELSYNQPRNGPQEKSADSCGLWCLLRAAVPGLSPTEFAKLRDK